MYFIHILWIREGDGYNTCFLPLPKSKVVFVCLRGSHILSHSTHLLVQNVVDYFHTTRFIFPVTRAPEVATTFGCDYKYNQTNIS